MEQNFIDYVIKYYTEFPVRTPFRRSEVIKACELLMAVTKPEWDSVDRERVRDIILLMREWEKKLYE